MGNPKIVELARLLKRTPGSVSMKLSNFARLDPVLQARGVVGLRRGARGEEGLAVRELLVASHIVPWSEDPANRLNARNGLCLNPLHDRAFDRHLMWIDSDLRTRFAPRLHERKHEQQTLGWLLGFEGKPLVLPKKFAPDPEFRSRHADAAGREREDPT